METVFDSPQWEFTVPTSDEDTVGIVRLDICSPGARLLGTVRLQVPTELFKFAKEVAKTNVQDMHYYLDKVGDRWYLQVVPLESELGYDLWYYTKSTLPVWAKGVAK